MEERELPAGWEATCLADVSEKIVDGSHNPPKPTEEGLPMLSARNITDRRIEFDVEHRLISPDDFEVEHRRTEVADGDVLLTIVGAIGRTAVVPDTCPPFTLQRSVAVIKPSGSISSDFLSYALESPETQAFLFDNAKGTAQKGIYLKQLQQLPIRIAPLNEQRRIAAKLDTTLAAVESCRQHLEGVADLIKRFRQAVLEAATTGELTREWRENRAEPEWNTKAMGECGAVTGGITKNSSRAGLPLQKPYLRVANVYHNRLELDDLAVIGVTESEYAKTVLRGGDLLIVEGNGSLQQVGRVAIWEEAGLDCVHQNHLIRWRSSGDRPKWALYWLMSPVGRDLLEQRAKSTTGLHTLSVSKISGLPIPVPSLAEQDEIIDRVEALFSLADQLEAKLNAARQVVERLTPALLAKAFRGELVSQDPSDEPASVLLERIRAARQAEAAAGKPSRRGRKQAAANPAPGVCDAAPVPPDLLIGLLRECGALSERALLAASELAPECFQRQLAKELDAGRIREDLEEGERVLVLAG